MTDLDCTQSFPLPGSNGRAKGGNRAQQLIHLGVVLYVPDRRLQAVTQDLEDTNIVLNKNLLPYDDQSGKDDPSGLRIGFQDITRRGFCEGDIKHLCDLMLDIFKSKRKPAEVKVDVLALKKEFTGVKYGFQTVEEALSYSKKQ